MRLNLRLKENSDFFGDADNKIAICSTGLHDWFDFPQAAKKITLDLSNEVTDGYSEDSASVYYYPSAKACFKYDTYGLTKDGMFEELAVLDYTIEVIIGRMDLPPQGILYVSLEYEE